MLLLLLLTEGIQDDDMEPEDVQPFPTLERLFDAVDKHTGFNVEIKYPLMKAVSIL